MPHFIRPRALGCPCLLGKHTIATPSEFIAKVKDGTKPVQGRGTVEEYRIALRRRLAQALAVFAKENQ